MFGLEQLKWSAESTDMVKYDVTMPFIRMVAGPMDYTQGAMRNASRGNYRPVHSEPMSQGTRCRQLAEYVGLRVADHDALRLAVELHEGTRVLRFHGLSPDRMG